MARSRDLDDLMRDWPYEPGEVSVRRVKARDGREVLQMRVDMGVVQMEIEHRPDGSRPQACETYFDYLLGKALHDDDEFVLDEDQCDEVDREMMQFYQRRMCWLALRDYERAIRDADHNLALMDFVKRRSPSEDWVLSHEQFRPFIIYQRTQAAAMHELEDHGPERAIAAVNDGLERIRTCFVEHDAEEHFDENEMVSRLVDLRESVRKEFHVGPTLDERLSEAIQSENYELAAKLRDRIAQRKAKRA